MPVQVTSQYQLTTEMWEEKIVKWYATHHGMSRLDLKLVFLVFFQCSPSFHVIFISFHLQ